MAQQIEPYEGKEPYAFVSYCRRDTAICEALIRRMDEKGIRLWYDKGIHGGETWTKVLVERLAHCYVFVMLITDGFIESSYCNKEFTYATNHRIPIVPILLEGTVLSSDIEFLIGATQFIQVSQDFSNRIEELDRICKTSLVLKCIDQEELIRRVEEEKRRCEEEERREKEREEAERREKERREAERLKKEREKAEQREKERLEAERLKKEREEAEQREKKRREAERLKKEREKAEQREKERLEAERLKKEREEAEQREKERQAAKQRKREQRQKRIASARAWLSKHYRFIGLSAAGLAALVLLIVGVRALINSGSPESTTDTTEAVVESVVSAGEADDVRAEMDALFADAQTFTGDSENWEDFVAMLNDDSVSAIIIPKGTELSICASVSITKPVLVEEGAYFGAWYYTVYVSGENACLYVKGDSYPTSLLRTVDGGRIVLGENGVFGGGYSGALWLENESDFINLGGSVHLQSDQIVTCSERALRASSTEVCTAEEFTAALDNENVEAIAVVSNITVEVDKGNYVNVCVPLIIDEGASLTIIAEGSPAWDNTIFMDAACLINHGTLNAFVKFRNANGIGILDNEYGASWTGGTFETDAVLVNYGDMTVTQTNSCAKGSDQDLEETGHFINEGIFTVADGNFYVNDGIFCNTNSGTIIVAAELALPNGATAINCGAIQVESGGEFASSAMLMNLGTIEIASGGQLGNSGVLLNWSGATVDSANTANNGLILVAEDSSFTSLNSFGGRVETIAALDEPQSGSWTSVSTAAELKSAMDDSSVEGVFLNNLDSNCVVSGDLTVTKPLVILVWGLEVTGTLTVENGYIATVEAGIAAQSITLEEDTFLRCSYGIKADDVNIGKNASLYYTYIAYPDVGSDGYEESLGNNGQIIVDGGALQLFSSITLENSYIAVSNGGTVQSCGYTVFENCTVDIDADSSVQLGAYLFDTNTVITNNGTVQIATGSPIDWRLEGTFINNGTAEIFGMEVSGRLQNNGQITCTGGGTNSEGKLVAISAVDGGEIRGNEIQGQ